MCSFPDLPMSFNSNVVETLKAVTKLALDTNNEYTKI